MELKSFIIQKHKAWPLVLALDVSDNSIKYLLLRRTGVGVKVERFGRYSLDSSQALEPYEKVQKVIHWLFEKDKGLKRAKIVMGLEGSRIIIKKEQLPSLSRPDLLQTISFGMQQEIGPDGEGVAMICDYETIRSTPDQEGNLEYMTMGAPEDLIEDKIAPLLGTGVVPVKVIPSVAALANLIRYIPELQAKKVLGLLDIGAHRSMLVFIKDGAVDFFREIVVGGNDFSKSITGTIFHEGRAIQFANKEAEEFKFRYGYPLGFSDGMTFHGAPLGEVGTMMRPVVERLSGEIERSIGFYKEKAGGKDISALYLIGGGARLRHLTEVLSENLGISISLLPYPQKLRITGDAKQKDTFRNKFSEQAISLSLALESTPEKNLLPEAYAKIHRMAQIRQYLSVALAAVVIILAALSLSNMTKIASLKKKVSLLDNRVAQSKSNVLLFDRLSKQKGELEGEITGVSHLIKQDNRLIQVLRLISHSLPENLSLVSLIYGQENAGPNLSRSKRTKPDEDEIIIKWRIHVMGTSKQPSSDVGIYLAQFIVELEKSGYFSNVNLIKEFVDEDTKKYSFEIKAFF